MERSKQTPHEFASRTEAAVKRFLAVLGLGLLLMGPFAVLAASYVCTDDAGTDACIGGGIAAMAAGIPAFLIAGTAVAAIARKKQTATVLLLLSVVSLVSTIALASALRAS